ncbi:MAG: hypothetical protein IJE89_06385 [Bacilli bacterium]|nr:hypothetical protein [Bacilli bacterium]
MGMSYIKMMKELDLALPDTSKLDYTKITRDKLWRRVYGYLVKIGVLSKLDKDTIVEIKDMIYDSDLYGIDNDRDNSRFDQNNYLIKNEINFIRIMIIKYICLDLDINCSCDTTYWDGFGNIDEIAKFVSINSIYDKVMELLNFTKADNYEYITPGLTINYLLLYYGVSDSVDNILMVNIHRYKKIKKILNQYIYAFSSICELRGKKNKKRLLEKLEADFIEIKNNSAKNVAIELQFMMMVKLSNHMSELREYKDVFELNGRDVTVPEKKISLFDRVRRRKIK